MADQIEIDDIALSVDIRGTESGFGVAGCREQGGPLVLPHRLAEFQPMQRRVPCYGHVNAGSSGSTPAA
jgi:hypothetical protein